jgi:hypothetical protein
LCISAEEDFFVIGDKSDILPSFINLTEILSSYILQDIHGGGLAAFIRTDIPARRRHDLECKTYHILGNFE